MSKLKSIILLLIFAQVLYTYPQIEYCSDELVNSDCSQLGEAQVCGLSTYQVETFENSCFACHLEQTYGNILGECNGEKILCSEAFYQQQCSRIQIQGGVIGCFVDANGQEECYEGINPCQICFELDYETEYFYLGAYYDPATVDPIDPNELPVDPIDLPADLIECVREYDAAGNIVEQDIQCYTVEDPVCAFSTNLGFVQYSNNCEACRDIINLGYLPNPCEHPPPQPPTEPIDIIECDVDSNGVFYAAFDCSEDSEQVCAYASNESPIDFSNACEACSQQFPSFTYGPCYPNTFPPVYPPIDHELPNGFEMCEQLFNEIDRNQIDCASDQEQLVCAFDGLYYVDTYNRCQVCLEESFIAYGNGPCSEFDIPEVEPPYPTEPHPTDMYLCERDDSGNPVNTENYCQEFQGQEVCAFQVTGAGPETFADGCEICFIDHYIGFTLGACEENRPEPGPELPPGFIECERQYDSEGNFIPFDCPYNDEIDQEVLCSTNGWYFAEVYSICEACSNESIIGYAYGNCQQVLNPPIDPEFPEDIIECQREFDSNGNVSGVNHECAIDMVVCAYTENDRIEFGNICEACFEPQIFGFTPGNCEQLQPPYPPQDHELYECEKELDDYGYVTEVYHDCSTDLPVCAYTGYEYIVFGNACEACYEREVIGFIEGPCENHPSPLPNPEDYTNCEDWGDYETEEGEYAACPEYFYPVCAKIGNEFVTVDNDCFACTFQGVHQYIGMSCEEYFEDDITIDDDYSTNEPEEDEFEYCPVHSERPPVDDHDYPNNNEVPIGYPNSGTTFSENGEVQSGEGRGSQEGEGDATAPYNPHGEEGYDDQNYPAPTYPDEGEYPTYPPPQEDEENGNNFSDPVICPQYYEPVCGFNGYEYIEFSNECFACGTQGFYKFFRGSCGDLSIPYTPGEPGTGDNGDYENGGLTQPQSYTDGFGRCDVSNLQDIPYRNEQTACPAVYQPVCGQDIDGNLYTSFGNSCEACNSSNIIGYFSGDCENIQIKRIYCPTNANSQSKDCPRETVNEGKGIQGCYIDANGVEVCNISAKNFCDLCYGGRNIAAEYYYIQGKSGSGSILSFTVIAIVVISTLLLV